MEINLGGTTIPTLVYAHDSLDELRKFGSAGWEVSIVEGLAVTHAIFWKHKQVGRF